MNRIEWTNRALKELRRIPESKRILEAVTALKQWPDCQHVKKLHDRDDYRLRVGRYRVIFRVIDQIPRIIRIEAVRKRDEQTY